MILSIVVAAAGFGFVAAMIALNVRLGYERARSGHFSSAIMFVPTIVAVITCMALKQLEGLGGIACRPSWVLAVVVADLAGPFASLSLFRALGVGQTRPGERTLIAVFDRVVTNIHGTLQRLTGTIDGRRPNFPQVRGAFALDVAGHRGCRIVLRPGTTPEQQAEVERILRTEERVTEIRAETVPGYRGKP